MKQKGYLSLTSPEGLKEYNTLGCGHCGGIVVLGKDAAPHGYCGNCTSILCKQCDSIGTCFPFEKWLDQVEKKAYQNAQLALVGIK